MDAASSPPAGVLARGRPRPAGQVRECLNGSADGMVRQRWCPGSEFGASERMLARCAAAAEGGALGRLVGSASSSWPSDCRRSSSRGGRSVASASGSPPGSWRRCSLARPPGCSSGQRRTMLVVQTRSSSWMEEVVSDSRRRWRSWHVTWLRRWRSPPAESWTRTKQTVCAPGLNRSRSCASPRTRTAPEVKPVRWRTLPDAMNGTRWCSSPRPITSHEPARSSSGAMTAASLSSPPLRRRVRCPGLRPWGTSGRH
jgi:hypothetical protein